MKNLALINTNHLSKSACNYPFSLKGMNKTNYLYMQIKNNYNHNQKPILNLNPYIMNINNNISKSKSKSKTSYEKNHKIKNIKSLNKRISSSQINQNFNFDNSFNINNNNRNNSEKIRNNKNIREAGFLGYSKNQKQMKNLKQKNNIITLKGINFNQKLMNDNLLKTNINKSERNKTPNIKKKENLNNVFKINPSDYSLIMSNSSLNGNNLSQNNINPRMNMKVNKYSINNNNNSSSIKNKSKNRTNSDHNIIQNKQHKPFQPKNIFSKFKRKKTSNISQGFGYNNIRNNNKNYIYFGNLLEENKNSSHSVNSICKVKEEKEKEKNNINKSQTQNSIKTNDTSGVQINVNSNILSLGSISNYNINNHFNQSLNVDCHEINISLLGKKIQDNNNINNNIESKPEKIWKGKNIKCIHDLSKTGLAGDEKKVNQDNYFIFKNFVQGFENIYMGVCDGHGYYGHEVSGYIKENLPMDLNHYLKQKNLSLNELTNELSQAIKECFIQENQNLLNNNQIDSDLSGTTCISVIYTPQKLFIANIGDSRCVLGKYDNKSNKFIAENLSRDHKPTIPEEAERILKVGGRIRPMRDEDGEFIGPLRVYMKEKEMPGLAMTRSFGDYFGSTAGTISEPEVTEHILKEEDKFIVLASDGLYEFIDGDEVVKYVGEFYKKNDIVGCCEFLYKESCKRWIDEEEDTIDDITIIVVFFDDKYEVK